MKASVLLVVIVFFLSVFELAFKPLTFERGWTTYADLVLEHHWVDKDLAIDKDDRPWMIGVDGVRVYDPNSGLKFYPFDLVLTLTIDTNDKIWIGSYSGVHVLTPDGHWFKKTTGDV